MKNLNAIQEERGRFLHFIPIQQILEMEKEILKASLSLGEITVALKNMNNNEPPDSDGFPVEFYNKNVKIYCILLPQSLNIYDRKKPRYTTSHFA